MLNVKVGDEVIVREASRGGRSIPATVTEVRRKLFTVRCEISWLSGDYRLDTGKLNGGSTVGYGPPYVLTVEEEDRRQRQADALAALNKHRIKLDYGHKLTLEQVEALAEVARSFASQDEEG